MPADLEHPWLGLESYQAETRAYFFGRELEVGELHLRLRNHPLLVLYGRSGLGKTSILNAGLIPRLLAEQQAPVLHRFDYNNEKLRPAEQLRLLLFSSRDENGCSFGNAAARADQWMKGLRENLSFFDLPEDSTSWFWLRVHWRGERPPAVTHVVLDQFEEVFTRGAERKGEAEDIRDRIGILLHGGVPPAIAELIAREASFLDYFDPDSRPVRLILSLRDDYVYALNRWRQHLPALGENNFELRPLRGMAAFDAIYKPGELRCHYRGEVSPANRIETGLPPIASEETARRIVRFSSKKGDEIPLEEIEAVPPILSLLCRELNERRFAAPLGSEHAPAQQITFQESDADIETIITAFYERCLAGRPEAVRIFVEEELVSYSGARLAQDEKSILRVFEEGCEIRGASHDRHAAGFGDAGAARACLGDLVSQRLLSPLGGDTPNYELIHDLLAGVVEKSRATRRDREAIARQAARQQARFRRQRRIALIAVAVLVLGCVALVAHSLRARRRIKYRDLVDAGNRLYGTGDYSSAYAKYKEASQLNASETDPWFGMGDALVRQTYGSNDAKNPAMLSEAIAAYQHAVETEKGTNGAEPERVATAYVGIGDVYAVAENPDVEKARAFYKLAQDADPESPDPPIGYGNLYLKEGRFHSAIEQYTAAVEAARKRNVASYGAHAGLGNAYCAVGRYQLAIDEFNRALGASPGSATTRLSLATARYMSNPKDPVAAELFRSLLGSKMKRIDSLSRTSLAYLLLEKANLPLDASVVAEAVRYLEDAYQKDPFAYSCFRLGIGRALQGDEKQATQLWNDASRLQWGNGSVQDRFYSSLLGTLLGEPRDWSALQEIVHFLEDGGAAGVLETVRRDVELVRRSGLFDARVLPVVALLDASITKAREKTDRFGLTRNSDKGRCANVPARYDFEAPGNVRRRAPVPSAQCRHHLRGFDVNLRYQGIAGGGNSDLSARSEGIAWIGYARRPVGDVS